MNQACPALGGLKATGSDTWRYGETLSLVALHSAGLFRLEELEALKLLTKLGKSFEERSITTPWSMSTWTAGGL